MIVPSADTTISEDHGRKFENLVYLHLQVTVQNTTMFIFRIPVFLHIHCMEHKFCCNR